MKRGSDKSIINYHYHRLYFMLKYFVCKIFVNFRTVIVHSQLYLLNGNCIIQSSSVNL